MQTDDDESSLLHHGDWLCVPFHAPEREALRRAYALRTVPSLVLISPSGDVLQQLDSDAGEALFRRGVSLVEEWMAQGCAWTVATELS